MRAAAVLLTVLLLGLSSFAAARNFYDILQVSRSATEDQIKRSYRKLALKYHPDKNPGNEEAGKKFAEINHAYEVLTNAEQKRIYDQYGEEGLKQHQQGGGPGGGFGQDIFSQFFGGGFGFGQQEEEESTPKGQDVRVQLEVTLEDLYLGKSFQVHREKNVIKPAKGTRQCNCKNKMVTKQIGPGMFQQFQQQVCQECPNVKYEPEGQSLTVEVDRGMSDGQEVTFFEEGEPMIDGEPGDLRFYIRTKPHPTFRREGNNLHMEYTTSLVDALVGFSAEVAHLDGHSVEIGSKGVTRPGEIRRIVGEGMPVRDSMKHKGDLFVQFTVDFPASLTEAQKDSIRKTFV
eukprot:jgi/Chlat1/238/Chrsp1S03046